MNVRHSRYLLFGRTVPTSRRLTSSSVPSVVRTRFAPSPTGELHLGGLRSALYNYLFARAHGGTFILRIEDTDVSRTVPGAAARLLETLDQVGLRPDEGEGVGGQHGPYTQSERLDLYRAAAEQLVSAGAAYRCFCTKQRLALLKRQAASRGQKPRYDNRCRRLSPEKLQLMMEKNVSHVIRLKLEDTAAPVEDLVCGPVAFDVAAQEGDPILLKADGFPTYHLASVVDDRHMEVTHVLRGIEWQVSTPKHIAIYRALGWQPPQFAHLPLITNPDGSKLSKRHGAAGVGHLLQTGHLPEAVTNYVCLAGGGFRQLDPSRLTELPELVRQFDLGRVHVHSCRLQPERLQQLNLLALQRRFSAGGPRRRHLLEHVRQLVTDRFSGHVSPHFLSDQYVERALSWALENSRISRLEDLVGRDLAYMWAEPAAAAPDPDGALGQLAVELRNWPAPPPEKEALVSLYRRVAKERAIPFSSLMKQLRRALSGVEEGPGVAEIMVVLGREETVRRLSQACGPAEQLSSSVS